MKTSIDYQEIYSLFNSMSKECFKKEVFEKITFDPISVMIFYVISNHCRSNKVESWRISSRHLAKLCHTSRTKIFNRLKAMARYGLIKGVSKYRKDSSGLRENMTLIPNPTILLILGNTGVKRKMAVIRHFVNLGVERLNIDDDVQGFRNDCLWGREEKATSEPISRVEDEFLQIISREDELAARKEEEALLWRDRDEKFINASADIWVFSQSQMGYGTSRPNWEGNINSLSPAAKKERTELTKTFQKYGGRVTALAWYVFAGGVAELDNYGNPRFTLIEPHRQFSTIDKKPSQFAKHFNAILKDEIFLDFAKNRWAETKRALSHFYGDVLEIQPRFENEFSVIGFDFGEAYDI